MFFAIVIPLVLFVAAAAAVSDRYGQGKPLFAARQKKAPGRHAAVGRHAAPVLAEAESPACHANSEPPPTVQLPALRILPSLNGRTPKPGDSPASTPRATSAAS